MSPFLFFKMGTNIVEMILIILIMTQSYVGCYAIKYRKMPVILVATVIDHCYWPMFTGTLKCCRVRLFIQLTLSSVKSMQTTRKMITVLMHWSWKHLSYHVKTRQQDILWELRLQVRSLQLMWGSGARKWFGSTNVLQWRDNMTTYEDSSPSNGCPVIHVYWVWVYSHRYVTGGAILVSAIKRENSDEIFCHLHFRHLVSQ